jgi:anti-sigma B factor antagonist
LHRRGIEVEYARAGDPIDGTSGGCVRGKTENAMSPEPAGSSTAGFMMRTDTREDAIVVYCIGRLTSENSDSLKKHVRGHLPHTKRIVLDLNELIRMDSSGLGAIVGLYVSAKKEHCELLLINYNKSIRDLLGLTNLLSMFEDCARTGMRMP